MLQTSVQDLLDAERFRPQQIALFVEARIGIEAGILLPALPGCTLATKNAVSSFV
jgi:hypothetical protein